MGRLLDYKICKNKFLGMGSYSKVYICIYTGNDDTVPANINLAIKIIDTGKLPDKSKKIIDDEIYVMNIIMKDPHPNIVECYDIIMDNNMIYIVMEYCDSGDMRNYLKKPIKEKWCQFFFCQLANGLRYLNSYNILHRDIKPRNILLTNNKKILKIADFGFAKQKKERISLYDTICGSPLYMAPELMNSDKYNNQTDLWSIGMILYEMLYGFHPYGKCVNMKQLKYCVDTDVIEIPPTNTKNRNISRECINLLKKLLQKRASKRLEWRGFFNHPWLSVYKTINNKNDEYRKQIYAASLGPMSSQTLDDTKYQKINIIENFIDEELDDSKFLDSDSDSDSDYNIHNYGSIDSYCMFEMDDVQ
uniref:Serine/threonine protein kinase n=1 Tax=Mimivirus LCMiAC01 TaxID=2506608 RepID=A0A481Z165_9VIRU|nr:MAG: serine/threonine protein kinase [Mimivirus LCMiAC01]